VLQGTRAVGLPVRWLAAVAAAGIALIPLGVVAYGQRGQISWLKPPDTHTLVRLAADFAGSPALVVPVAVLAVGGAAAGFAARRDRPFSPGTVALP